MQHERPQTFETTTAGDGSPARAPLASAAEGGDPTTLERHMTDWHQRRAVLRAYISQHMQEGIDYYTLRLDGKVAKPSLSKAGSEQFLNLFHLHAQFRKDDDTWEMLGRPAGVLCYVCTLSTTGGAFVGEGRGARDAHQDKDMNKAIKMAQKSAQIDAILRVGALSDYFTQDLEDRPAQEASSVRQQKKRIIALLQHLGTSAIDKAGYEEAVQQYTGLALVPEAYQAIIARLEGCVNATLPDRDPHEEALPALSDGTTPPRGAPLAA